MSTEELLDRNNDVNETRRRRLSTDEGVDYPTRNLNLKFAGTWEDVPGNRLKLKSVDTQRTFKTIVDALNHAKQESMKHLKCNDCWKFVTVDDVHVNITYNDEYPDKDTYSITLGANPVIQDLHDDINLGHQYHNVWFLFTPPGNDKPLSSRMFTNEFGRRLFWSFHAIPAGLKYE